MSTTATVTSTPANTTTSIAAGGTTPAQAVLDLSDIQGLIIRGYTHPFSRHFFLRIEDAAKAKAWVGSLVNDPSNPLQINSAAEWPEKPGVLLNLGMTSDGLAHFDIPGLNYNHCFQTFRKGATANSTAIGDTGDSSPANWVGDLGNGTHMVLSMWTLVQSDIETYSDTLRAGYAGFLTEQYAQDGAAMPDNTIHFGYMDSISQPHISGVPLTYPDAQAEVPAYYFVVQDDAAGQAPYQVPAPTQFWLNGCFGALRILKQEVKLFSDYLGAQADKVDPDLLAAQFCGRWSNGTPLDLSPLSDQGIAYSEFNNFNYVTPNNDAQGTRCPYGSHLRRTNGRNGTLAIGMEPHRVVRRAMPYGPKYDKNAPDNIERGLVGYFMGIDLSAQFEFLMQTWVNSANFSPVIGEPNWLDPILGANDGSDASSFDVVHPDGSTVRVKNIPRFVITRGSAYCFLPSISGLKYLSSL